jgi:hypothetical protein
MFGKLIQGMTLDDQELFRFDEYPLLQPDMDSPDFETLYNWTYTKAPLGDANFQLEILNKMRALNYFAQPLLQSFESIPISSLYATFMKSGTTPHLTLGYPNSKFFDFS